MVKSEIFRLLFKKESQIILAKLDTFIDAYLTRECRFIFNNKFYSHSKIVNKLAPLVDIPDHLIAKLTKAITDIDNFTATEKCLSTYIQKNINSAYTASALFVMWPNELNMHLQKVFNFSPEKETVGHSLDTASKEYALINQQILKNILL